MGAVQGSCPGTAMVKNLSSHVLQDKGFPTNILVLSCFCSRGPNQKDKGMLGEYTFAAGAILEQKCLFLSLRP